MLNKVMLIGNLGADPEARQTTSGSALTEIRLATSESYKDKDGQRVEKTEWHRVVVFGSQAESVARYLSKGSKVYVEGRIQTREWQDKEGQKRYTTEIIASHVTFLDKRSESGAGGSGVRNNDPAPF